MLSCSTLSLSALQIFTLHILYLSQYHCVPKRRTTAAGPQRKRLLTFSLRQSEGQKFGPRLAHAVQPTSLNRLGRASIGARVRSPCFLKRSFRRATAKRYIQAGARHTANAKAPVARSSLWPRVVRRHSGQWKRVAGSTTPSESEGVPTQSLILLLDRWRCSDASLSRRGRTTAPWHRKRRNGQQSAAPRLR